MKEEKNLAEKTYPMTLEEKEKLRREVRYLEEKAKGRTGKPQKKQL